MIETFFVFLAGFFFAFLQFSFFFTLQANVSSAGLTYLLTTVCWLGGAVIGLSIRRPLAVKYENLMIATGAAGFYVVHLLVQWRPFDNAYFVIYAPLMVLSSIYAGYFFNSFRGRFNNVKNLFFWENNGFMFGIASSFLAVSLIGQSYLVWILAVCAGAVAGLRSWFSFRDQRN